jgi:hypothetical protein
MLFTVAEDGNGALLTGIVSGRIKFLLTADVSGLMGLDTEGALAMVIEDGLVDLFMSFVRFCVRIPGVV